MQNQENGKRKKNCRLFEKPVIKRALKTSPVFIWPMQITRFQLLRQPKRKGNFFLHTNAATTSVYELENNIKVYTHDRAIYISGNLNSDDVIAVYGVDGKLHYRKYAEKTVLLHIDAAKRSAGVFLISIQQNAERVTMKVVISE
ncbi:MAG: hypothetical protein AB7S72_18680 [Draconibacterium sp.]